ncbi:hypothetical protein ACFO0O_12100, partial [Cobetia amphilecti]|uniref:hypothetical protein n=1 Tax=Cobetia amphilecti TaxID=1055104 RepID=UPI0036118186
MQPHGIAGITWLLIAAQLGDDVAGHRQIDIALSPAPGRCLEAGRDNDGLILLMGLHIAAGRLSDPRDGVDGREAVIAPRA